MKQCCCSWSQANISCLLFPMRLSGVLKIRRNEEVQSESATPVALVVLDQVLFHHVLCFLWEKQGTKTGVSFVEIIKMIDEGISGCTGEMVPVRWSMSSYSKPFMQPQAGTEQLELDKLWLQDLNLLLQQLFLTHHSPSSLPISLNTLELKYISKMGFLMP